MNVEGKLVVLDIDFLGRHDFDHDSRGQARHGKVRGLLGARFVTVHGTGHVVRVRVAFGDRIAGRVSYDQAIDVELLERGIEVEFDRAELFDATCILDLDLLQVCLAERLVAVERVAGDAVDEVGPVTFHATIEWCFGDAGVQRCRERHRGKGGTYAGILAFAEYAGNTRDVLLDSGIGRRIPERRVERLARLAIRPEPILGITFIEVAFEGTIVLLDKLVRECQDLRGLIQLVVDLDLRKRVVGVERPTLGDPVQNCERFLVVALLPVQVSPQSPERLGHPFRCVFTQIGLDLLPLFAFREQTRVQGELVVLAITLAEYIVVDPNRLVDVVGLIRKPRIPALYDLIVTVVPEARL